MRVVAILLLLGQWILAQPAVRRDGSMVFDGVPAIPDSLRELYQPYAQVYGLELIGWGPDGGLVITGRRNGAVGLGWLDSPSANSRPGPVIGPDFEVLSQRPKHEGQFLCSKDATEGREVTQLYLFDSASSETRLLTDGRSRTMGGTWSPDGETLACAIQDRNSMDFDVNLINADGRRTRLTRKAGTWVPAGWSPDGKELLVIEYKPSGDQRLYLMKLPKRTLIPIYSGDRKVIMSSPVFLSSGQVAYISDLNSQYRSLRLWNPDTGEDKRLLDLSWDITWLARPSKLPARPDLLIYTVNQHGRDVFYSYSPDQGSPRALDIPQGITSKICLSPDGEQMALELDIGASPMALYTYSLAENKSRGWRSGGWGAKSQPKVPRPKVVDISSFDGRTIPAYLYMPPRATPTPVPVMLMIHGGPEAQHQPIFAPLVTFICRELGVAVLAPNIRGSDGYGKAYRDLDNGPLRENALKDVGSVLDWLASQPQLDANRVVIEGGSYGGFVALASAARYPSRLRGVISVAGPTDFRTLAASTERFIVELRRREFGDERDPKQLKFMLANSPLQQVDQIRVPVLLVHGQNDPRVPVGEAEQMKQALRERGVECWYLLAEDEGHNFTTAANQMHFALTLIQFLKDKLER